MTTQFSQERLQKTVLFTPGPATTDDSVKRAMFVKDISPRVEDFQHIMSDIRRSITEIVATNDHYTTVLLSASGTAAVESMLVTAARADKTIVIINNGAYGERMCAIAEAFQLNYVVYKQSGFEPINLQKLDHFLQKEACGARYLAVVHHETSTGLLNELEPLTKLCDCLGLKLLVDAMSSFAGYPINMADQNIEFLAASANKNLQGMPGISFVISERQAFEELASYPTRSYYLDLCAEYAHIEKTNQARFTPSVPIVYALKQAIIDFQTEGQERRHQRYQKYWKLLLDGITALGLEPVLPMGHQIKYLLAVKDPKCKSYDFHAMHEFFYAQGITIYPGKLDGVSYFRLGCIGALTDNDIHRFLALLKDYLTTLYGVSKEEISV